MTRKKVIKKKLEIVFNPQERKDFLTGFRKRKNERRKRAKEELEHNLKEERKRIRQEIKEGVKHMKKSFEPLRELTDKDRINEDEYEDDDVKVKIVELTTSDLAAKNHLLGENQAIDSDAGSDGNGSDDSDISDMETNIEQNINCIPGMDYDINRGRKRKHSETKKTTESDEENDKDAVSKPINKKLKTKMQKTTTIAELKSKKDLDRLKKNDTLKKLKKSKVFKMKERFDRKANQKKAKRDKNNTLKSLPKNQRKKLKFVHSRYQRGRMISRKDMRKKQRN